MEEIKLINLPTCMSKAIDALIKQREQQAFIRGQESMRERAANVEFQPYYKLYGLSIRALPILPYGGE